MAELRTPTTREILSLSFSLASGVAVDVLSPPPVVTRCYSTEISCVHIYIVYVYIADFNAFPSFLGTDFCFSCCFLLLQRDARFLWRRKEDIEGYFCSSLKRRSLNGVDGCLWEEEGEEGSEG